MDFDIKDILLKHNIAFTNEDVLLEFINSKELSIIIIKLINHINKHYPEAKIKMDISFDKNDLMVYIFSPQIDFEKYKNLLKTFEFRHNEMYKKHVVVVDVKE